MFVYNTPAILYKHRNKCIILQQSYILDPRHSYVQYYKKNLYICIGIGYSICPDADILESVYFYS